MRFAKGATRAEAVAAIMGECVRVPGVTKPSKWCRIMRTRYELSGNEIVEASTGRVLVFQSEEQQRVIAYIRTHAPRHFAVNREAEGVRSLLQQYNRAHLPAVSAERFLRTYCAACGVSAVQAAARQTLTDQRKRRRTNQKAVKATRKKRNAEQAALAGERQRQKLSLTAVARPHSANIAGAIDITPTLRLAEGIQLLAKGTKCTVLVPGLFVCRKFAGHRAQHRIYAALDSDEAMQKSWGHLRLGAPSLHTYTTEASALLCGKSAALMFNSVLFSFIQIAPAEGPYLELSDVPYKTLVPL